jgi:ubiquinone biosynthesis protein
MILEDGFFHADPHPGNMLVEDDGRLGVLDCGMVGRVDDQTRNQFEAVVLAILEKDPAELTDAILQIATAPPDLDRALFRAEINDFCGDYLGRAIDRVDIQQATQEIHAILRRFRIVLPAGMAQLIRTLALLEGTSRHLTRDFNLLELLEPYARKMFLARFAPKRVLKESWRRLRMWDRLFQSGPDDIRDILDRLRQGTFDVHLQHRRLDAITNRLVYGILASALFVGSTLMLSSRVPPVLGEISVLGAIGALAALLLGARLLWEVQRSGGLSRQK